MIATSGCRRPVASASSMPSIPGIFTSLRSKSNSPLNELSAARAVAPSTASVRSWPSPSSARTTKARRMSSSSAMRILAIALLRSGRCILCVRKADHHIDGIFRRRDKAAAEIQLLARAENAAARQCSPGVNFLSGVIPRGKPEARDLCWLIGDADNRALNDKRGQALLRFLRNPHIFEFQIAQIHRQPNGGEQRSRLREKA